MTARSILLAGVAALLPVVPGAAVPERPGDEAPARWSPPTGPLLLTRTVYRSLADGKQIIATRRYAIRFSPEGDGYRLDGEMVASEISAPPVLSKLADMERQRPDRGLFPARLDRQGMIRPGDPVPRDPALRERGMTEATAILNKAPLTPEGRRERMAVLGQAGNAPGNTVWPAFLFNPGPAERVETRKVPLPGGSEGQIEVRIRVGGLLPGGLPSMLERIVTTRLSGTERVSREVWTLAPLPPG